ncbi:MFS transporter [Secundilactobacillus folii]|uniref:MFS transporter n=1 Tax=Secundilactobacillus folii TaxID=2678357 RepID=A0A7X2XU63_9LACO|nr:MFS transporter [Secundilactobacillus folii]MTV81671.1 MFS transporter [Secundilactobacillus folii]
MEINTNSTSFKEKLGFTDYVGFGFGDMAVNFTFASLGMFVVFFYTDVVGISAGIIGTLMLFSRSFDGIIDLVIGGLVDKTHSRWGKTRPWLLFGAIPFALLTISIFAVPANWSETAKVIYIFLSYNILMIAFSSIAIPYGTLNSLVTRDQHQRETFNLFRMFMAQIGVLIVTNATMPMVNFFGNKQVSWVITYTILSAISVVLLMIVFKSQKERVQVSATAKIPLKTSLKAIGKNKYWWIATIFFIIYSIGYALNQGSTIYYAKYILHNDGLVGILTMGYLIPVLIGFVVISKLFSKYGKTRIMLYGSLVSIAGYLITLIAPSNFEIVMIAQIIKGFGQGPLLGGVWAMFPDTIEYGEWKTHVRIEGLLYSGGSLGQKIGVGLGTALTGWVLAWGHYNGALANQSVSAINSIYQLFIYIPIIIYILQIIMLRMYDLDKKYPKIMRDLAMRRQ